jgi:hypothetical protein
MAGFNKRRIVCEFSNLSYELPQSLAEHLSKQLSTLGSLIESKLKAGLEREMAIIEECIAKGLISPDVFSKVSSLDATTRSITDADLDGTSLRISGRVAWDAVSFRDGIDDSDALEAELDGWITDFGDTIRVDFDSFDDCDQVEELGCDEKQVWLELA